MRTTSFLPALDALLLGIVLVINGLATALPINGRTTAQISDSFPVIFVPAGYVFAIWGLVYLGLAALVVYALTPAGRADARVGALGWWLPLNLAANASWILCWHYGLYPLSLAVMLVILSSLAIIHRRLDDVDARGPLRSAGGSRARSYWFVRFPTSLYLGWISVATIANASVVLLDAGWSGAPLWAEAWALLMVVLAAALNLVMVMRQHDLAFGGVGVWALAGIAVKRAADYPNVAALAAACALLVACAVVLASVRLLRPRAPSAKRV